jgi:hypothetical protein
MSTIDDLAPATAASDSDELMVSQNGIARKITRAQILAGLQPQLVIGAGALLGRKTSGTGAPEQIAIGANLTLTNGTLAASGSPFVVASLPAGTVPASGDSVAIGQGGHNATVTYGQFMSGLAAVTNIDASRLLITPTGGKSAAKLGDFAAATLPLIGGTLTGTLTLASDPAGTMQAATKNYVDNQLATALPKSGGALSGALTLAANPTTSSQAATKQYVDGQVATALPRVGGALSGALTLAADPSGSLQAATKRYVDGQVATAVPKVGGTLSGPLTLATDPAAPLQAATKQYVDTRVSRNGDTLTGPLVLSGSPATPLQAATKQYVDARIATAVPNIGGTLSGALTLAADPASSLQAATRQYVDKRALRTGDTLTGPLVLAGDPATPLQAATKAYVDNQMVNALPKSGGALIGALTLSGDPTSANQAATKHYVDTQVATALPISGGTLTGALTLPSNPTTALQATTKQYVDSRITTAMPLAGGTLTGPLTLAADPTLSQQAATKHYVDFAGGAAGEINVKAPPYNAQINGTTDDTAAFKAAYQAAPAGSVIHVPNGVTVLQNPNAWGLPLTKRVKWIVDGTSLPDGTPLSSAIPGGGGPANSFLPGVVGGNSGQSVEISQNGSQPGDFAVLHSSYIVNHTGGPTGGAVSANTRNDTIIYNSPNNYVWGALDRLLWCGTQSQAGNLAQHVGRYIQTIRENVATDGSGKPLPQPQLWAACLEYRDTTGRPSSWSGASLTVEMDWIGNGPDDGNARQIQSLVVAQHNTAGTPVEVSTVVGVYLAGGSTGHVYRVFGINVPFSTAVLDTTYAQQLPGAAAIRMAAGHAIAFEPTAAYRLSYDSATTTLRWNQGAQSYVVGKGITVGWQNAYSGNATLASYLSGNIVFLAGNASPYTITLPAANSVAAGTGFTLSVVGSAAVTIAVSGKDTIDNGPVTLRPNDRYHIVSDATAAWREVFRTNAVNPRFSAPPILPSYTVALLPASPGAGAKAFASNGRKPGEGTGAGSGVEIFHDGAHWISVCGGAAVAA